MACSCNPATGRPELVDGLRLGFLSVTALCRSGVRIKPGVNMVVPVETRITRLSKEGSMASGKALTWEGMRGPPERE